MSTAQRAIDPAKIKTLENWVAHYIRSSNLEFDTESREPTVYAPSKEGNETKVKSFPWIREFDIPTILTNPSKYPTTALTAAKEKIQEIAMINESEQLTKMQSLKQAMEALILAWREYHSAVPSERGIKRRQVLLVEAAYRELEESELDSASGKQSQTIFSKMDYYTIYRTPIQLVERGIQPI